MKKVRSFAAGREIFRKALSEVRPSWPVDGLEVAFYPFANVSHTLRLRDGRVEVRLSDLLAGAPDSVIEAVARILAAKLVRRAVPEDAAERYRRFLARPEVRARTYRMRRERGRKFVGKARGRVYDLELIFGRLNRRYFASALPQPRLTWSRGRSRTNLGEYDPAHDVLVVSRTFDRRRVPSWLVDYIVFHEMLHLKFARRGGNDCLSHTPAFRREERRFPRYCDAIRLLRRLPD